MKDKAGLEESRINEEFRDFLVKWGPRLLIGVALIALAFSGVRWFEQKAEQRTDEAFTQLALATSTQSTSPDTLLSLADQYDDVGAVAHVARMTAGEAYLAAVRRGVVIGAQADMAGQYPAEELLDGDLRTSYLTQARQAFQKVVDAKAAEVHLVRAHMGLAAVAEAMGELEQARTHYERAAAVDREAGYGAMALVAEARLNSLDVLADRVTLPATASLPRPEAVPAEERDAEDPFGLGGLDFGDLGFGQEPVGEPQPEPEPAQDPAQDPTQDPAQDPGQ